MTNAVMIATAIVLAALVVPFVPLPLKPSWLFIFLSTVAHCGYYLFLLLAYREGELSQVYPLARGTAPLLVAISGFIFAGESLSVAGCVGVALVSIGVASLAFERGLPSGGQRHAVTCAVVTGLFIAFYSVVDGLGVRRAGMAASYISWLFLLEGIPFLIYSLWRRGRSSLVLIKAQWRRGVLGGIISTASYAIAIWAMDHGALAQIVSLRETSVIFGALIGTLLLGDRFGPVRIGAAILVAGGNLLLHLS
jgi:drug/metabolite transporter (DMT)-like permease